MILPDVNVLIYAHREESPNHEGYRAWLEELLGSGEPYGIADIVLSGFLRIVTHPKIFDPPTPLETALSFVQALRVRPTRFRSILKIATGRFSSGCATK